MLDFLFGKIVGLILTPIIALIYIPISFIQFFLKKKNFTAIYKENMANWFQTIITN